MGIFDFLNKKDAKQKPTGKVIRHIVCLCYDAPFINSLKPQMQDFIIKAEQERGNHLFTRPCSRCCASFKRATMRCGSGARAQ